MTEQVSYTEAFLDDDARRWGWQCFACGAEAFVDGQLAAAERAAEEHDARCPA